MHLVVCVKEIMDPEIAPADFHLDIDRMRVVEDNIPRVLSPFDENALELALQVKDRLADTRITVISLGSSDVRETLRKCLACGADEAVWIKVDFENGRYPDATRTASLLAEVIREQPSFDLVLCGRQAGDWDAGQVGFILAELLGIPCVSVVSDLKRTQQSWEFTREAGEIIQRIECAQPCLVSVTNSESNQLRLPKVRDVMRAGKKPLRVVEVSRETWARIAPRTEVLRLDQPQQQKQCYFIEGETGEELARNLAEFLFDRNLV